MLVYNFVLNGNSQSVMVLINGVPKTIHSDSPHYSKVVAAIKDGNEEEVYRLVDVASSLNYSANGKFEVVNGVVHIGGEPVCEVLSKKLVDLFHAELPYEPFLKFWENLQENPDSHSVENLYRYLESNGNVALTDDGCFIAYKGVRQDWTDCHSGTMDNSVGTVVKMKRNKVNSDPNVTCSYGLHVAAWGYATGTAYGGADRYLMVKVNPRDVVAVPVDYNNQKMRVCEYEVLKEVENPLKDTVHYVSSDGSDWSDDREDDYEDDCCGSCLDCDCDCGDCEDCDDYDNCDGDCDNCCR